MNFPKELKYTKDHEWIRITGDQAIVGITDFAQRELGDIVYVDVDTQDEILDREQVFGSIEAVKTVSDLLMPVSGRVVACNESLESEPEKVNTDPYGAGWIVKIEIRDKVELADLLCAQAYENQVVT